MGVQYMAQNRERAKTLGGRELTLHEVKALRYVREHRRNPVPPEELGELDAEIGRMETANLLHDYDVLRMVNRVALVKLAIPTARLNRNEKLHLITWVGVGDRIRHEHRGLFHLAQLLTVGDGGDRVVRDLNLAYLFLAILSNTGVYREQFYIEGQWDKPTKHLEDAIDGLIAGPLGEHLEAGRWFGPPRQLATLPEDPIRRARILALYEDYLEVAIIRNVYDFFGRLELPTLEGGPPLINRTALRLEKDPDAYIRDTVDELSRRLEKHLAAIGG